MRNQKSGVGKRANLYRISVFSLVFSFISIIYIFISVFWYATANDYLFYELQNITETLENQGIVINGTSAFTQTFGDDFRNFNFHLDDLWFISYLIFIISSFVVSYRSRKMDNFSFLGILFYGIMGFLFILTIFSTLTTWFQNNILLAVLPTVHLIVPKFYYYLDHLGVFSAIHLVICLVINKVDFDFAKIFQKKKQEEQALKDEEVV